jgi:hypothetical protein
LKIFPITKRLISITLGAVYSWEKGSFLTYRWYKYHCLRDETTPGDKKFAASISVLFAVYRRRHWGVSQN